MTQFWEKKKREKKRSALFVAILGVCLGALFLMPDGFLDSVLFRFGLNTQLPPLEKENVGMISPLLNPHASPLPVEESDGQWVPWEQKLGRPQSVAGLINPEDSRQRPTTVALNESFLPDDSQGRPVEEDVLSWALGQAVSAERATPVFSHRAGRVSRRAPMSNFAQSFKNGSRGCLDGPSCALMQLAQTKTLDMGLKSPFPPSVEYQSAQLASIFDGSDGYYRRLMLVRWSPSSPPEVSRLGVPLF
jgi:hypothetical protein